MGGTWAIVAHAWASAERPIMPRRMTMVVVFLGREI